MRGNGLTIAVCYVTPEGVVLGADSTSSVAGIADLHYFDFTQKIFEIGENSTLGMLLWGLGGVAGTSYRTLIAQLDDDIQANPATYTSVADVAQRWARDFWAVYSADAQYQLFQVLHSKAPHNPATAPPDPAQRTEDEERVYRNLKLNLRVGFLVAGYVLPDRTPLAIEVTFDPISGQKVAPPLPQSSWRAWRVPKMMARLLFGCDMTLAGSILASGKWTGTGAELQVLIDQCALTHAALPIRDAVDFVHSCIHSTIKALKFSSLPQTCGGPIEIAVITSDRKFRWVRHKAWDAAIIDGAL